MGERENICFSTPTLRKPQDQCQAKSMLWSFYNTSWLDIWTFWLLVILCSMPRSLQQNCKANGNVKTAGWVTKWAMWTQHNPRVPLGVITMISKVCFLQMFKNILKFLLRAFFYLNPSTITFETPWGKLQSLLGIKLTTNVTLVFLSAVNNNLILYFLCHR